MQESKGKLHTSYGVINILKSMLYLTGAQPMPGHEKIEEHKKKKKKKKPNPNQGSELER
jgi:hypothetical protein